MMDLTGVQMPLLDLSQQGTLGQGWQSGLSSQPSSQVNQSTANTQLTAMHPPSLKLAEPDPLLSHRRHIQTQPTPAPNIEAIEVRTPTTDPGNERQGYDDSPASSSKAPIDIPMDSGSEFEDILDFIEEAGFESIDVMAARYYSANFKAGSTSQLAQASSRSRDLRKLLRALQKTSTEWDKHEKQAYEEEIIQSAKSICLDELSAFHDRQIESPSQLSLSNTEMTRPSSSPARISNHSSVGKLEQLRQQLLREEASQSAQQEKRKLRQCMPGTWSLLSELANKSDLPPAQVSQIVYTFLQSTALS